MPDPVKMLVDDHTEVKKLFAEFEKADGRSKTRIVNEAITDLEIHAAIEEEIFYPALERNRANRDMMAEAEEEHHVAKMLMAEIKRLDRSSDSATYDAKFTVLAENVRHHIKEEETEMLPKAKDLGKSELDELGTRMEEMKARMKKSAAVVSSHSAR